MRPDWNPAVRVYLGAVSLLFGCTLDPVDLAGRECPCGPGWSCVGAVCVQDGQDAGRDVSEADAPDVGVDSSVSDVGRDARDGNSLDTGEDIGVDVGMDVFDAGSDTGPPSVCDTSTALFCNSFEAGLSGWSVRSTLGEVTPDDGRSVGGAISARSTTTGGGGTASMVVPFEGLVSGTVYARVWAYVPSSSMHRTMTFLLLGENTDDSLYPLAALQITSTRSRVYVGHPHERWIAGAAPTFPLDRWVCTTLSAQPGNASPRVTATVDGVMVADETLTGAVLASVDTLEVGIQYTDATSLSAEIFVDEVELDTSPLPCE